MVEEHQQRGESQRAMTLQSPAFRQKTAQGAALVGNEFLKILEEQWNTDSWSENWLSNFPCHYFLLLLWLVSMSGSCVVLSGGRAWLIWWMELLPLTHLQLIWSSAPAQTLLFPLSAGLFRLLDEAHLLSAGAATCDFHLWCHCVSCPTNFASPRALFPASSLQPPALLPPTVTPLHIPPILTHQSFHQSLSRRHCGSLKQHLLSRLSEPEPQSTAFNSMMIKHSFNKLPVFCFWAQQTTLYKP